MLRVTVQFDIDRSSMGSTASFANEVQDHLNDGFYENVSNVNVEDWETVGFSDEQKDKIEGMLSDIKSLVSDIESICYEFDDYDVANDIAYRLSQIESEVSSAEDALSRA